MRLINIAPFLFSSLVHAAPPQLSPIIGFLEDNRESDTPRAKKERIVRPAFRFEDGKWQLISDYKTETEWTIAFDGKNLGMVKSKSRVGNENDIGKGTHEALTKVLPMDDADTHEFRGWSMSARRPLVLVNNGNFRDPETWKRMELKRDLKEKVINQFRVDNSKLENCEDPNTNKPKPFPVTVENFNIIKSYQTKSQNFLVGIQLKNELFNCDGLPDSEWSSHWYNVSNNGKAKLVGRDMLPLDAGDYNGDGKSEFIFFINRYNRDGYALYWDSFSKSVELTWNYH